MVCRHHSRLDEQHNLQRCIIRCGKGGQLHGAHVSGHVHARDLDVLVRSMLQQPFGSLPQVVDDVFSVDHKLFLQHCRGKSHQIKGREQDVDNGDTYGISFRKLQDVYGDYINRSCNGKLCGLFYFFGFFFWLMSSACLSTRQHKWQSYRPREVVQ